MSGGSGNVLDGGAGNDWAAYAFGPNALSPVTGVVADLSTPSNNTGVAVGDTYVAIENLAGTAFADTLRGDANDNELDGYSGDDILQGLGGNDTLNGDTGFDRASFADATGPVTILLTGDGQSTVTGPGISTTR